jgi:hypothetical protein
MQDVPGKGTWETATLERATTGLTALVNALREPTLQRSPGMICNMLAMIPPQVLLISDSGKLVIPKLPKAACGLVRSNVIAALNALSWTPVSVRLVTQVSANTMAPQTVRPIGTPKSIQTMSNAGG